MLEKGIILKINFFFLYIIGTIKFLEGSTEALTIKFQQRYTDISFGYRSIHKNVQFLQVVYFGFFFVFVFVFCLATENTVTISAGF